MTTANILYVLLGVGVGTFFGFLLAAILTVGKRADEQAEGPDTHCEGDGALFTHLSAKRYCVSRPDGYVALLQPDTFEVAYLGTSLREVVQRSMEAG